MKVCYVCAVEKEESKFPKSKATLKTTGEVKYYVERTCYACRAKKEKEQGLLKDPLWRKKKSEYTLKYANENPEIKMYWSAKSRAKKKGFDFNLDKEDIVIPDVCPLLGIKLKKGDGYLIDESPSLDRINKDKGYVKGNVWVISHKANTIKNNALLSELEMLVENLRKKINDINP